MAGATWCFLLLLVVVCPGALRAKVYLNKWAVEIPGGDNMAHYVANQHGFRNLGKVISFLINPLNAASMLLVLELRTWSNSSLN